MFKTTMALRVCVLVCLIAIAIPAAGSAQTAYIAADVSVMAINTQTNAIIANIDIGPYSAQNVAVSPSGAFVYVVGCCRSAGGAVIVIRTDTNTVANTIPTPGVSNPYGIAVNSNGTFVYVTDFYGTSPHELFVISTATNSLAASIAVGPFPHGVVVSPGGATAYVANSIDNDAPGIPLTNTVSVVDLSTNAVTANIPVGHRPHALSLNPSGSLLYVSNYDDGTVSVISTSSNAVVAVIPLAADAAEGIAFSRDGSLAYVCHQHSNFLSIIDTVSNMSIGTVVVGQQPFGLALNPAGDQLYVANQVSGDVSVIATATNSVVATLPMPVGSSPVNVAITSVTTSPTAQIQNLITSTVMTNLAASIQSQLDAKLNAALATLDAAHSNSAATAANQLQAFVNAVKADVHSGKLTCSQAQVLVTAAQQIVAALAQPPLSASLDCQ